MLRPLHDWLLVELEPERKVNDCGLVLVAEEPVRTAKVLAVGPGRHFPEKFVRTVVEVGERVAFFIAGTQTKQGKQLNHSLPDNQVLIRESDVLMILMDKVQVTR